MAEKPKAKILGTGIALGDRCVSSAALDRVHSLQAGSVARLSGVETRYWCETEDQITLGTKAARAALAGSKVDATDLDAILHAAAVPWQAIPATAPLLQRALNLPDGVIAAFDINATCLSFLAALQQASAMIETGRWQTVLVVSSERASRGLNWADPATAGLFGDGAAAVLLGSGGTGVGAIGQQSHASGYDASSLVAGGTRLDHDADPDAFEANRRFGMDGRALFRLTRTRFQPFVEGVLRAQGWGWDDVDCVVPHQASPRALAQMARALDVEDRMIDMASSHGNMIAASMPVALHQAIASGRAGPGSRVLMLGTAAGVSFGAGCVTL